MGRHLSTIRQQELAPQEGELPIEKLRRIVSNLDYEYEYLLQELPTLQSILEYFDLWDVYDTEYLAGMQEAIADGANPDPLQEFIKKYNLSWEVHGGC